MTASELVAVVEAGWDVAEQLSRKVAEEWGYDQEIDPDLTAGRVAFHKLQISTGKCETKLKMAKDIALKRGREIEQLEREIARQQERESKLLAFIGDVGRAITSNSFSDSDRDVIAQQCLVLLAESEEASDGSK